MKLGMRYLAISMAAGCLISACGSAGSEPDGSGGSSASGGASGTGGSGSGGSGSGGNGSGGSTASGGSASGGSSSGGTTGSGGSASGGSSSGGSSSGGSSSGGATGSGGSGMGGAAAGASGSGGPGGGSAGAAGGRGGGGRNGAAGSGVGGSSNGGRGGGGTGTGSGGAAGGSSGTFDPCPSSTEPCKILPLGDSITWGINYGGGYRVKLFAHAVTDQKNITFVGYDMANPPSSSVLNMLNDAKTKYVNRHEGHSGWTIQQDDDLVTGKSTANNDGVSYSGKKVVADFDPHIVLVHLGTNDMYMTPAGADTRLGTLIDHIVADAPNALVVVATIIPLPSATGPVKTFNDAVPGLVQQRASAGKHVVLVDQFKGFNMSDLSSDNVHPNEGGYEKMAGVFYTAIKPYLH